MRFLNFLRPFKDRNNHRTARRPSRAGVTLNLEALEARWLPNGTMPASSLPPPSFIQAAISLYTDGVNLGKGLVNQIFFHIPEIDAYPVPPADLNADIAFNSPYVGPFAPLFVLAGASNGAQVQYQVQLLGFQTF